MAMRQVYDSLAVVYEKHRDESSRLIAAPLRLYARLPLSVRGSPGAVFCPAAALPATRWLNLKSQAVTVPPSVSPEVLTVFELLVDRWQLPWTQGSQAGNLENLGNWYQRLRGLHQIVMWCWNTESLGSRDARLMTAITILDDPRLVASFDAFKEPFVQHYQKLNVKCVANKSGSAKYGIVSSLVEHNNGQLGGEDVLQKQLDKAKDKIHQWVFGQVNTSLVEIQHNHPVLELRASIAAAIGWGFFGEELLLQVINPVLHQPGPGRWLLHVARDLKSMRNETTWWTNNDYALAMPDPAAPLVPSSLPVPEDLPGPGPDVQVQPAGSPGPPSPNPDPPLPAAPIASQRVPREAPGVAGTRSTVQRKAPSQMAGAGRSLGTQPVHSQAASGVPTPPVASASQTALSTRAAGKQKATVQDDPIPGQPVTQRSTDMPDTAALDKSVEDPTEEDNGVADLRVISQEFQPTHLIHSVTQSNKLFHNLGNRMAAFRDNETPDVERDRALVARLKTCEAVQIDIMSQVSEEREKMRKSMLAFGDACIDAPYGSDVAIFALPGIMALLWSGQSSGPRLPAHQARLYPTYG
ncbi:hypothetical protein BDV93DRAFT_565566 [Ceratobasidium sp. AG-I]|nr:hypothetical protein BDV93DRAFT_565566 [Ceratobasidium sp. AG-I]